MTLAELQRILPHAGQRAARFHPHLTTAMTRYQITGSRREAAFTQS